LSSCGWKEEEVESGDGRSKKLKLEMEVEQVGRQLEMELA